MVDNPDDPDPYEVLGLSDYTVSREDVAKAARRLGLKYHPDKNPSVEAAAMFLRVQRAKETLLDPVKRAAIDDVKTATLKRKAHEQQRMDGMDDKRKRFKQDLEARLAGSATTAMHQSKTHSSAAAAASATSFAVNRGAFTASQAEINKLRTEGQRLAERQSEELHKQQQAAREKFPSTAGGTSGKAGTAKLASLTTRQLKIKWKRTRESHSEDTLARLVRPYGAVEAVALTGTKGTAAVITFEGPEAVALAMSGLEQNIEYKVSAVKPEEKGAAVFAHAFSQSTGTGTGTGTAAGGSGSISHSKADAASFLAAIQRSGQGLGHTSAVRYTGTRSAEASNELLQEVQRALNRRKAVADIREAEHLAQDPASASAASAGRVSPAPPSSSSSSSSSSAAAAAASPFVAPEFERGPEPGPVSGIEAPKQVRSLARIAGLTAK